MVRASVCQPAGREFEPSLGRNSDLARHITMLASSVRRDVNVGPQSDETDFASVISDVLRTPNIDN